LATYLRYDFARTRAQPPSDHDVDDMARTMQAIEEEGTARRAALRAAPAGMFHRGGRFDGEPADGAAD